ncbi:LysM peptidoglycan-binding domain-containing protein [Streptomyces oceani]|uniref:Peptidoglycan-binding protein n=1 Tax=Streptomyces oceani TaxID=1075402 RepID=A0A1E7KK51_9ACTN|nr:LysM peptidoglycan-binding domain-containing protein [Streptomyces oceani]OEV04305.1 peptidoglycan-binding protein [Streptomyces oceani]
MSRGRHRRSRLSLTSRASRMSLVLMASSAGIAAPLFTAGAANATPAPAAPNSQVQQASSEGSESAQEESYTVAAGDTLHTIAEENGVDGGWSTVYDANKDVIGGDPNLILPGQELSLSASGQPSEDDSRAEQSASGEEQSGDQQYADNLDGWINEALAIMEEEGIPGSYEGIERNIMRESGGDPSAINNTDINAQNGTPSIGLLQVIKPTFDAYHVEGTPNDQYDPVANIVAACNYAADRYGSIDNVDSAY